MKLINSLVNSVIAMVIIFLGVAGISLSAVTNDIGVYCVGIILSLFICFPAYRWWINFLKKQ